MRNDLQIIQSAVGDIGVTNPTQLNKINYRYFKLYSVDLPDNFRGLPPNWFFAILPSLRSSHEEAATKRDAIITEARQLIKDAIANKDLPIVVVSDDPNIKISDQFQFNKDAVFFLDNTDLPSKNFMALDVRDKPFILAVKNKFDTHDVPAFLNPYSPNKPVNDWRFFGRKKEVKDIVDSESNFFVIGSRRIGKTSLLQEVQRQLVKKGETVYWIPIQDEMTIQGVMDEIVKNISMRDFYQVSQIGKLVDINYLSSVIKRLKSDKKKITLIFDELGNVLSKHQRDDWRFIGTLRELSHSNDIRVIISAFQEVFLRQKNDFDGPFVNFGTTLKVNVFSNTDLEDILIHPLGLWTVINDKPALSNTIKKNFGRHPLMLQYLGKYLFQKIFETEGENIEALIHDLLTTDELLYFDNAVDDLFNTYNSFLERYIFVKICMEAEKNLHEFSKAEITQRDLEKLLTEVEIKSDLDKRNFLLDRLCMKGLLYQHESNRLVYKIAIPLIYTFLKQYYPIDELCLDYRREITHHEVLPNLV